MLTSNTSFAEWGALLGNEILASALLDRLLHHAEVMPLSAMSQVAHQRRCQRRGLSRYQDIPAVVSG